MRFERGQKVKIMTKDEMEESKIARSEIEKVKRYAGQTITMDTDYDIWAGGIFCAKTNDECESFVRMSARFLDRREVIL
jgi:hypothetical protein